MISTTMRHILNLQTLIVEYNLISEFQDFDKLDLIGNISLKMKFLWCVTE